MKDRAAVMFRRPNRSQMTSQSACPAASKRKALFHGSRTVAPLKRTERASSRLRQSSIPRFSDRGPIEASLEACLRPRAGTIPRFSDRGPIEATMDQVHKRWTMPYSTVLGPWPH